MGCIAQKHHNSECLAMNMSQTYSKRHEYTSILFLKWTGTNCLHTLLLLNGDEDDVYLQSIKNTDGSKSLFTGHLIKYACAIRWTGRASILFQFRCRSQTHTPLLHSFIIPIDGAYMGKCNGKWEKDSLLMGVKMVHSFP